jgi:uncharacterized protein with HEPN domain
MSKRGDREYLADIHEAIQRIQTYTTGLSYAQFRADEKTQDAVIRNIEILGEAVKHLSLELVAAHGDVEWKGIAGMRDKLVHEYFGVNLDILWDVVTAKLPPLRAQIERITQNKP